MKKQSDPNGIRTRVTAVKGRCPGPLDDRVAKAGQYRNCHPFTQGKLPARFFRLCRLRQRAAPWLQGSNQVRVNQRGGACGCAFVPAQNFAGALYETLAHLAILQKPGDRSLKRIDILNLDRAFL